MLCLVAPSLSMKRLKVILHRMGRFAFYLVMNQEPPCSFTPRAFRSGLEPQRGPIQCNDKLLYRLGDPKIDMREYYYVHRAAMEHLTSPYRGIAIITENLK